MSIHAINEDVRTLRMVRAGLWVRHRNKMENRAELRTLLPLPEVLCDLILEYRGVARKTKFQLLKLLVRQSKGILNLDELSPVTHQYWDRTELFSYKTIPLVLPVYTTFDDEDEDDLAEQTVLVKTWATNFDGLRPISSKLSYHIKIRDGPYAVKTNVPNCHCGCENRNVCFHKTCACRLLCKL